MTTPEARDRLAALHREAEVVCRVEPFSGPGWQDERRARIADRLLAAGVTLHSEPPDASKEPSDD